MLKLYHQWTKKILILNQSNWITVKSIRKVVWLVLKYICQPDCTHSESRLVDIWTP